MYLQSCHKVRVKTNIFRKFIQFSLKQGVFLHALSTCVHGRGLRRLTPPLSLRATLRVERVNDEPVEVLNLLFFTSFFWKWIETFKKPHFFAFGPKQCFYLTHSSREYFEKLAFKKNKKHNFKLLYLKS